jgi:replication-associated recombination protein RarA
MSKLDGNEQITIFKAPGPPEKKKEKRKNFKIKMILFLGPPGSGKTTQAEIIQNELDLTVLDINTYELTLSQIKE